MKRTLIYSALAAVLITGGSTGLAQDLTDPHKPGTAQDPLALSAKAPTVGPVGGQPAPGTKQSVPDLEYQLGIQIAHVLDEVSSCHASRQPHGVHLRPKPFSCL